MSSLECAKWGYEFSYMLLLKSYMKWASVSGYKRPLCVRATLKILFTIYSPQWLNSTLLLLALFFVNDRWNGNCDRDQFSEWQGIHNKYARHIFVFFIHDTIRRNIHRLSIWVVLDDTMGRSNCLECIAARRKTRGTLKIFEHISCLVHSFYQIRTQIYASSLSLLCYHTRHQLNDVCQRRSCQQSKKCQPYRKYCKI